MTRIILSGLALLLTAACSGGGEVSEQSNGASASAEKSANSAETASAATDEGEQIAATTPEPIDPERAFRPCAICHSVADPNTPKGKIQLAGPNLFEIYGAPAARLDNFAYSQAMRDSGVVWNDEALNAFIERPSTFLRGNRMAYAGERNADKRTAIVEYLKAQK